MNNKYLGIDFKKAQFFEHSKEEVAGYEKYTSSKGNVSYRNFFLRGVRGEFKGIRLKEGNFGEQLQVGLEDNGTTYILSINTVNGNGYDKDYFIPLLQYLKSMVIGEIYLINPYRFTPDGEKYEKVGVSVKDASDKTIERGISLSYYKNKELIEGDIPALNFELNERKGKYELSKASLEARDKKIDSILVELVKDLGRDLYEVAGGYNVTSVDTSNTSSSTPTNKVETKAEAPKVETPKTETAKVKVEEDDDLPF